MPSVMDWYNDVQNTLDENQEQIANQENQTFEEIGGVTDDQVENHGDALKIISTARGLIGKVSYMFGSTAIEQGTGDCSAFTQYVFKKNGITLGRDTESQYTGTNMVTVKKENLQAGDLVFFKDTYESDHTDGVSHVGIYSGDNQFIDLGSKGVSEHSLSTSYWEQHYLGVRRVKGVDSSNGTANGTELKWYGDIVAVVLSGLLVIGGVVLLAMAVGLKIPIKGGII